MNHYKKSNYKSKKRWHVRGIRSQWVAAKLSFSAYCKKQMAEIEVKVGAQEKECNLSFSKFRFFFRG
jgi:hypothetical protein